MSEVGMLQTIIPKSDQLNADDLLGGRTLTITITKVGIKMDEQPVSLHYEGDNGKPYKPGKSMRRVLVNCWGADANVYVGRKLKLYCDPSVKFGGMEVGGIRISHMSHIKARITMALTATKAQRRPFTVDPLIEEPDHPFAVLQEKAQEQAALGVDAYKAFWSGLNKAARDHLLPQHEALKAVAAGMDAEKMSGKPEDAMPPAEPDPLDAANIRDLRAEVTGYSVAILKKCEPDPVTGKSGYPAYEAALALVSPAGQGQIRAYAAQRLAETRMGGEMRASA